MQHDDVRVVGFAVEIWMVVEGRQRVDALIVRLGVPAKHLCVDGTPQASDPRGFVHSCEQVWGRTPTPRIADVKRINIVLLLQCGPVVVVVLLGNE